ncbi:MAG: hypothetical protein ACR2OR_10420 [Hyphomicrobiales bacterium]
MRQVQIRIVLFVAVVAAVLLMPQHGFALTCPEPQENATAGVLKETSEDIEKLSLQLQGGAAGNEVNEIIFNLKKKYPGATSAEVVNYMITAYCPVLAVNKDLTEEQVRARLDEFAKQVRKIYAN